MDNRNGKEFVFRLTVHLSRACWSNEIRFCVVSPCVPLYKRISLLYAWQDVPERSMTPVAAAAASSAAVEGGNALSPERPEPIVCSDFRY